MRFFALMLVLSAAVVSAQGSPQAAQAAAPAAARGELIVWNMSPHSVDMVLRNVLPANPLRLAQLRQTFYDLQCREPNLREESFEGGKNLVCALPATAVAAPAASGKPSPSPGTILLIAHYSHSGAGMGAIDDWSGAAMLPFLYHALSAAPRRHTFLFAEVDGEAGARALYESLPPEQRRDLRGVVAFDALGLGPAQFYGDANDTYGLRVANGARPDEIHDACVRLMLCGALMQAAVDLREPLPAYGVPGAWFKTDVTREFRHHGVPSMLIHSVSFGTRELPGSERDTAEAIEEADYLNTVRLLSDYLIELDRPWPSADQNRMPSGMSRGRRR